MIRLCPPLLALLLLLPGPGMAQTAAEGTFDLYIRGLRAGVLTFSGNADGSGYGVTGRLESAGLIGALRHIRYDASAQGKIAGTRFTPERYTEKADTGRRQSEALMDYRKGVPQIKTYSPPRPPEPTDLDPATQSGTVDPLTALFATLRDVPAAQACQIDLALFDGKRRSALRLGAPEKVEGGIACSGEYRRLQGFTAEEMAEKTAFPFRVTYEPAGNGMVRVTEVTMETLYGRARLDRR